MFLCLLFQRRIGKENHLYIPPSPSNRQINPFLPPLTSHLPSLPPFPPIHKSERNHRPVKTDRHHGLLFICVARGFASCRKLHMFVAARIQAMVRRFSQSRTLPSVTSAMIVHVMPDRPFPAPVIFSFGDVLRANSLDDHVFTDMEEE